MNVRSMTGFASVSGRVSDMLGFTLNAKGVNHRFLDPHLRLPSGCDALEMELRRALKDYVRRGHVELTLQLDRGVRSGQKLNMTFLREQVETFRAAAQELHLAAEPDLAALLRMPGAMAAESITDDSEGIHAEVMKCFPLLMADFNTMREREGQALAVELAQCMGRIHTAAVEVRRLRSEIVPQIVANVRERLTTLLAEVPIDQERILAEAAIVAERGDVEEETVRLDTHVQHFLETLESGGEVGKRLDFLLQEFQREANTLLSKTSGSVHTIRITELGLELKTEIERAREQVQNLE